MEKIKDLQDLCHQYFDRIMAWYDGLEKLYQYGVLYLLLLIGLFIVSWFVLSRITK